MASVLTAYRNLRRALPVLAVVAMYAGLAADAFAQGSVATDRAALVALYDATGGQNWSDSTNWKTDAALGDWYGVTTDTDGRVTLLLLFGEGLTGPMPAALGNLSKLQGLLLQNNNLTGSIPAALGNLSNLTVLSLWGNDLSGSIPSALGNLSNLQDLLLYENDLTGPIPTSFWNLSNLIDLQIDGNALTGSIPAAIGNFSNLKRLNLASNDFAGPLPSELTGLSQLWYLNIRLTGLCAPADSAFQAWLATLSTFYGSTCSTTTPNRAPVALNPTNRGVTLCENCSLSITMASLFSDPDNDLLTYNSPSSSNTQVVTASIINNNSILRFVSKQAGTATVTVTARDPGGLTATQTIRVTVIDGTTTNRAPVALNPTNRGVTLTAGGSSSSIPLASLFSDPDNDTLTYRFSTSNIGAVRARISGNSLQFIPEGVGTATVTITARDPGGLTATQTIRVTVQRPANRSPVAVNTIPPQSLNEGGGPVPVPLANYFRDPDNDRLTYTATSSDTGRVRPSISGSTLSLIPVSLGTATVTVTARDPGGRTATQEIAVTVLSAAERDAEVLRQFYDVTDGANWFDSRNWKTEAPAGTWFGVSTEYDLVTSLHLVGNTLTGPLPASLGFLSELTDLILSGNRLTGPIPESLGNLSNLESLYLDSNRLTGPIPAALGQLSNLRFLDLSGNQLTGPIPFELTQLSQLQYLDIRNTELCMPPAEAYQEWLATINRFLGSTCSVSPREVLTALYDATDGPNWTNSGNWKTDTPLDEWYGVGTDADAGVTVVDLRGNGLIGSLPAALGGLSDLQRLDLGENELTGPIPAALGSLPNLRMLDLGKNELTGPIPAALGNLSELITLNLGSNVLSGSIPNALSRASKLELLYLHDNALTGSIPTVLDRLSNLEQLYLHENALRGSIPTALSRLSNLEQLYLHENALRGAVPDALGGLSKLEELSLAYNREVSGTLPDALHMGDLRYLNALETQTCAPTDWIDWVPEIYFLGELCGAESVTIDIAVVYTEAAREAAGGTRTIWMEIDKKIAETNQAFADSGVRHRVALVARTEVDYDETADGNTIVSEFDEDEMVVDGGLALRRLRNKDDGYMDDVHDLREDAGADLVHLLLANGDVGGVAGFDTPFGLSVLSHPNAFPHELGHNMRLNHDRYQFYNHDTKDRTISTGPEFGYVNRRMFEEGAEESSRWTTLMAYPRQCTDANEEWGCPRLFRFSNPRQMVDDDPLGVPVVPGVVYDTTGLRGLADAVAVLNAAGPAVAAWMDPTPISFSIPDRGGLSRTSKGLAGLVRVGYGRIHADEGSTPSGIAIYQLWNSDDVLISETAVPAAALIQEGRIFAEVDGPVNTGLAIANPNERPATISFNFTNGDGVDSVHGSFQLRAGQKTAKFLNESPFNSGSFVSGTFTFTSSVPIAVIAIRGFTNEEDEFLMTTLPIAPRSSKASDTVYFPHFTDGDGWATQVVLVNPTDRTITGTLYFVGTGNDTTAASVVEVTLDDGSEGSEFEYSIPRRSFRRFTTGNRGSESTTGSVRAIPDSESISPSGLVIFSYATGFRVFSQTFFKKTLSEAGVPASPKGRAFRLYIESSETPGTSKSIKTGLAVANTVGRSTELVLQATYLDGSQAGPPITMTLPPWGQIARVLDDSSVILPEDFSEGVLRITSTADVAVIGVRLHTNANGELKVTTIPVSDETGPATASDLYFAHVVDSAGWSTQLILFSGMAGQRSVGTLSIFDDAGRLSNMIRPLP